MSVGDWYVVIVGLVAVVGLVAAARRLDAWIDEFRGSPAPVARVGLCYFSLLALGSIVAIFAPAIVILALFAGILPGVFLWLSPSLLVYSSLWVVLRALLWLPVRFVLHRAGAGPQWRSILGACGFSAFVLILGAAIAAPRSVDRRNERISELLRAGDREPVAPIVLPDTVALDLLRNGEWASTTCETVCLRLLYNGVVKQVLVTKKRNLKPADGWSRYRIERRQHCPLIYFGSLAVAFSKDSRDSGDHGDMRENAVEHVKARIAAGECLIEEEAGSQPSAPTLVFRDVKNGKSIFDAPWSLDPDTLGAKRLELLDAQGRCIYRRTEVTWQRLDEPLRFDAGAGFLTTVTYAGLARTEQVDSPMGYAARDTLETWFGKAMRKPARPVPTPQP